MNPRLIAKKLLLSNKIKAQTRSLKTDAIINRNRPYILQTSNIEISVWPEFIDGKNNIIGEIYIWAYHIRIKNNNSQSVRLLNRYWRIIDEQGNLQEVSGEGVVGEQPVIEANTSYQYSSGVHLLNPSGIMSGKYEMKMINDDKNFEVQIPKFSLDCPINRLPIN